MTADSSSVRRFAAEPWDAPAANARTVVARRLIGQYAAGVVDLHRLRRELEAVGVLATTGTLYDAYARLEVALAPLDAAVAAVAQHCEWDHVHRLCGRCAQRQDAVHDAVVAAADAVVRGIPQRGVS